jgi:DUF1365 family protein
MCPLYASRLGASTVQANICSASFECGSSGPPRLLGYTFNPLSVYFCHRADGRLALMIYEVRNTFGDIHAYVLPVKPDEISAAGVRQLQDKLFYVSPFIEMAMRYHFRVSPPADSVKVRILESDREGPCSPRPSMAAAAL